MKCRPMDDGKDLVLISSDPYNVLKMNNYLHFLLICILYYIIILTNKSNTSSEHKQTVY